MGLAVLPALPLAVPLVSAMPQPCRSPRPACVALALVCAALLAGCATAFDIGGAATAPTPQQAAAAIESARGRTLAWGGMILAARNLADHTEFELLGYPLDRDHRPDRDAAPVGRFLAVHPGYLETADYREGRLVTVVGTVTGTRSGAVGEAPYLYPVLNVTTLRLWPAPGPDAARPRVHFGIGVGITR